MAQRMNVFLSFRKYMTRMLTSENKMKILLLDEETVSMISLVYSYAEILDKEVFGTEMLFLRKNRKKLDYMDAVVYIRPTRKNLYYLKQELAEPSYKNYRIFFSKCVPQGYLQEVATADKYAKVEQVFEYYADFAALGPNLFTTNFSEKPKKRRVTAGIGGAPQIPESYYNPFSREYDERTVDGIVSVLLSLKKKPSIRYSANSRSAALRIANAVSKRMRDNQNSFNFTEAGRRKTLLLILDRHDDPLTPLLLQWTYQAMVHDMSAKGIKFNIATLINEVNGEKEKEQIMMSEMTDMSFYGQNLYEEFIDVQRAASENIREFKKMKKRVDKLRKTGKMEDVQRLLTQIPLLNSKNKNAEKHIKLLEYIITRMDAENLKDLTTRQQQIALKAMNESESGNMKRLKQTIQDPQIMPLDKLKMAMLFALRHQKKRGNDSLINDLIELLQGYEKKLSYDSLGLIRVLMAQMGMDKRQADCFDGQKGTFQVANGFKAGKLTQTTPMLMDILRKICKNKLDKKQFPYLSEHDATGVPDDIIVFIVGGATYAEAKTVHEVNTNTCWGQSSKEFNGKQVILGGNSVLRSITFLKYLKELKDRGNATVY